MSEKQKTFTLFSDPSHGWLRVKRNDLKDLELLDDITHYSYQKGDYVYLEEDLDLTTFINAFVDKYGYKPVINCKFTNNRSTIRGYNRYETGGKNTCESCSRKYNNVVIIGHDTMYCEKCYQRRFGKDC